MLAVESSWKALLVVLLALLTIRPSLPAVVVLLVASIVATSKWLTSFSANGICNQGDRMVCV